MNKLNAQIARLSKDVTDRDNRLSSLSMDYDIKDAVRAAKARDVDIVFSLLDREKISSKDGKLNGVDEQLKAIKEEKSFLFDDDTKGAARGGFVGRQDIINSAENSGDVNAIVNDAIRSMAGR